MAVGSPSRGGRPGPRLRPQGHPRVGAQFSHPLRWPPSLDVKEVGGTMTKQIPLVDYLELGDDPHLTANECTTCGARFFDRRNACASCGGAEFTKSDITTTGEVRAFTIVAF